MFFCTCKVVPDCALVWAADVCMSYVAMVAGLIAGGALHRSLGADDQMSHMAVT